MSFFTQALTFPAIILPAFVGAALILAVLLCHREAQTPWRFRDLAILCVTLALGCSGLAAFRNLKGPQAPAANSTAGDSPVSFEADMLVTRGNGVDLFFNDWQHPPERVPVVAGVRHVYQFARLPRDINLIRFDPTDVENSRIVLYSLTVKVGSQVLRQFGPAELKTWTLHDLSLLKEEDGALVMQDATDDPILWTTLATPIQLPEAAKPPPPPSFLQRHSRPIGLALTALLLATLLFLMSGKGPFAPLLNQPCPPMPSLYRKILLSSWLTLVVVLLVAAITFHLRNQSADFDIGIEVDMMVSRGNHVDLWLNDWDHPPESLAIVPAQRHIYRFQSVSREITLLRLDPTDVPDARVVIYSLDFKSRTQVFRHFGPTELRGWKQVNLSAPIDEGGGLAMTDLNEDPILTAPLSLQLPGGYLQSVSPFLESNDGPFLLAITVFLLMLLTRVTTRSGRMQALLIAAAILVAYPVVVCVLKLDLLAPPPVTSTVGYSNYMGYDKANEFLAALCMMLLCLGLGGVSARLAGPREDEAGELTVASRRPFIWITHGVVFGMLVLYLMPGFKEILASLSATIYQYHGWDEAISIHWMSMVNAGLLPMRDFWYPYGGGFIQLLPHPWGEVSSSLHWLIVLWALYVGLLRVTGRRVSHALVAFGLILAPTLLGMMPAAIRYLVSVDIALLYVGIYDCERWAWKTHVTFALFVGYAFFYEPTQVIYASAGIAADTLLAMLSRFQGVSLRVGLLESAQVLKQRVLYVAVPMLAGIVCALLVFAAKGMLPGFFDFERSIGDQGDYGGVPSEISHWMWPVLQPETVFLLLFLLAAYAVYRWVRFQGRPDRLGTALIVLCGLSYLAIQKQVLRPHVMTQIRVFPYVALLIFGLIVWRERKTAGRLLVMVFLGCMLGIAVHRNLFSTFFLQGVGTGPKRIANTLDTVLHHLPDFDRANATLYSRARFAGFDKENAVVDTLTNECGLRAEDDLYVLGDYPIFYMLLNKRPPYVSNSYNSSPIYEQQKVLDWFHRNHPRFVIWGTDALAYDAVPHMVRLPLLYTYVVEHYRLLRAVDSYQILEVLAPDQAPDLKYWRQILGNGVDLGAIPGLARDSEYTACASDPAQCDAVLTVRYPQSMAVPRGKLTVSIAVAGVGENPSERFHVDFDVTPRKREYVVNLNRLWFWRPLAKPGMPHITAGDTPVQISLENERERRPVLY